MSRAIRRETAIECYRDRNETLRLLGFETPQKYLNSELWAIVRERAFQIHGRDCRRCKRPATQVHHASYLRDVLIGADVSGLVPVCGACHKSSSLTWGYTRAAKVDGLKVRSVHDTNEKMARKINRAERSKRAGYFCACGRMRKKSHATCKPCRGGKRRPGKQSMARHAKRSRERTERVRAASLAYAYGRVPRE